MQTRQALILITVRFCHIQSALSKGKRIPRRESEGSRALEVNPGEFSDISMATGGCGCSLYEELRFAHAQLGASSLHKTALR